MSILLDRVTEIYYNIFRNLKYKKEFYSLNKNINKLNDYNDSKENIELIK